MQMAGGSDAAATSLLSGVAPAVGSDAEYDPALAGLRGNAAYQQASPTQRAEMERNYLQVNPYRMSAEQLLQDDHFRLMRNGARGAQAQQHAERMLSMAAYPQAWQDLMTQYQQRYGNAPGAVARPVASAGASPGASAGASPPTQPTSWAPAMALP